MPQVDMYTFPDGHSIFMLAEGRLVNLGCALALGKDRREADRALAEASGLPRRAGGRSVQAGSLSLLNGSQNSEWRRGPILAAFSFARYYRQEPCAMVIEIHEPELENLIRERMASGQFKTVEDVLMDALQPRTETRRPKQSLAQFLLESPLRDSGLTAERQKDFPPLF